MFVAEGSDPEEVRAVLTELVELQRQAAAQDPTRLRGEAMWMFSQGASVEHVVAHFVSVGLADAVARPEAERLFAAFQRMRPCQRCGRPTEPRELVFDATGFSICNGCNLRDEIARSEQRGVARDLALVGVVGGVGGALIASMAADMTGNYAGGTSQPFCARCRRPTGVPVGVLGPDVRARLDPRASWVCSACWQRIA